MSYEIEITKENYTAFLTINYSCYVTEDWDVSGSWDVINIDRLDIDFEDSSLFNDEIEEEVTNETKRRFLLSVMFNENIDEIKEGIKEKELCA